jgi:hypothetical protein
VHGANENLKLTSKLYNGVCRHRRRKTRLALSGLERLGLVLSKLERLGADALEIGETWVGALKTGETWARRRAQMLMSIATNCNNKSTKYKYSLDIYVIDDDDDYPTLQKGIYMENRSGDCPEQA